MIHADLSIGTNVTRVVPLLANEGLCSPGVKLHGAGFIVTPAEARALGLGTRPGLEHHIRDYRNGRDLLQRPRGVMVIDLFGLSENEVMDRFPEVYQHVRQKVYNKTWNAEADKGQGAWVGREVNTRTSYKKYWWIFGEPRSDLRPALAGLSRYIVTVETAQHRVFHWFPTRFVADNKLTLITSDDAVLFGVLSSSVHTVWAGRNKGRLESRPVYVKTICFDPFPFPDATDAQRTAIAAIAERIDLTRRTALAESPRLTMTGLYNLVEAVRGGAALSPVQEADVVKARARIVAKLHDDLDAAVAAAYGWPADLAPTEIVARLVALNATRAAEEKAGTVRWLRPDYQIPRFAKS